MSWAVDYKAVKAAVTMPMVLSHYGVMLRQVKPGQSRGRCPLPCHTSKDSGNSLTVTGQHAWACQSDSCAAARGGKRGGNPIDFIAHMESCSFHDAAVKAAEWFRVGSSGENPSANAEPPIETELVSGDETSTGTNKPLGFVLKDVNPNHEYIARRGVNPVIAAEYGVGFGKGSMTGRVVFPLYDRIEDQYHLVGYAGRSIDDSEPRWKFPSGLVKSFVWGMDKVARDAGMLVIVESFWGVLAVRQAGVRNVVALMGRSLTDGQLAHLRSCVSAASDVIVLLDGDEPGREAANSVVLRLCSDWFVKRINLPDGEQPDTIAARELANLFC
jgi:DNA primase